MQTGEMNVARPLVQAGLLGEAIDHASMLVLVADETMQYVAVNQYACDVLGYTREELLGLKVTDVARYEGAPNEFRDLIASGSYLGRPRLVRKDGSEFLSEGRASETSVAGMLLYVAVLWPVDES